MRATSSFINVCSAKLNAKLKLWFGRKTRFLSSAHLALEMDVNELDISCSVMDVNELDIRCSDIWDLRSDDEISNALSFKHDEELFGLNQMRGCFGHDMKGIDAFVSTEGFLWRNEYKKDAEDDILRRIKMILECHHWDMESCIIGYKRIELDENNVIRILNVLFRAGKDAALALYFFKWCECQVRFKHTVRSVCTMIHILISGNMNHRAVDLVRCLASKHDGQGWWFRLISSVLHETRSDRKVLQTAFSMLIRCYMMEDKPHAPLRLISELSQFNFIPSMGVCSPILKTLLQSGQIELAWDFLEEILSRGWGCNISIISLFIHKFCMDGDIRRGWDLLTEIKKYNIEPDIVAYTNFINALSKLCCLKLATVILFKLASTGVVLDSVSVSSVIDGYCKVGNIEKSVYLLKIFKLPLNIFVYNSYLAKLSDEGEMLKASNLLYEMFEKGFYPDCYCYTTVIRGFCKIGDIDTALKFLAEMFKRGIRLSPTTHTVLINGYCKLGHVDMALELVQKMVTDGLEPDIITYNTIMDCYGKRRCLHKVFQILHNMKSAGIYPDNVTYNIVIHNLVVQGFIAEARELLDQLIKRGFSPDVITFTNMVSGFTQKGNFEEAHRVWLLMSEHNINPDVVMCSALLSGYCRASLMAEAKNLFFEMLGSSLAPDLVLYNTLIHGFCSVGDIDYACYLIEMMVKNGIIPNEVTHRILVFGFGKKRFQHPKNIADLMQKYGYLESLTFS